MPYVERYLFILMSRQLALPELKRYLLHCAQPYRTPKNCTRRAAIQNILKRRETRRIPKTVEDPLYSLCER